MGKRELEKKIRQPRDYYSTIDPDAALALKPFLYRSSGLPTRYIEPCAGGGHLIDLLHAVDAPATALAAYDIDPQRVDITQRSCLTLTLGVVRDAHCFITNPPFQWDMLRPILDHLPTLLPTWLLLPADCMHNKRMSSSIDFCSDIVSVGRLYWFLDDKGKKVKGVDNYAWFKFDANFEGFTKFHPRQI